MAVTKSVPVIDMQDFSTLPQKIVSACEEWGCFRLINHGVPSSLMSNMKDVTSSLHDLPMEIKMRNYNHRDPSKGYTPPNMASAFFESLSLYDAGSAAAVDNFCSQLDASPQQRDIIIKYTSAIHDLAKLLGSKLMEGLGLNGEEFQEGISQFKLNKYNYGPETVGLQGAVMHSDAGFFTILHDDDNVNGLEAVHKITGELISVDHVPGTLVINVGDAGKVWSNGRFHNVKHQVQCYKAAVRITIALFVLPAADDKVQVLPGLVDSDHRALYTPFDFDHYRSLRISTNSPTGEALEFFRSQPELLN
ncbi:adventitious rooting related oxygenase family protein [Dorcoceras hygrometricum]|uniref:Adventitious rooting related oxygenase family protein n=1 Tax=Dorcoceras hygrometricum TaxID=472368 RepID=A0A2Z7AQL5_9LAMI|nr:adventitious rooting related oxygenase family protein [Dorcoceras hygrometricum]KZV42954.1 adventitious rooting related oxygenase family protein [Dorcoceras hygrometricum]